MYITTTGNHSTPPFKGPFHGRSNDMLPMFIDWCGWGGVRGRSWRLGGTHHFVSILCIEFVKVFCFHWRSRSDYCLKNAIDPDATPQRFCSVQPQQEQWQTVVSWENNAAGCGCFKAILNLTGHFLRRISFFLKLILLTRQSEGSSSFYFTDHTRVDQ